MSRKIIDALLNETNVALPTADGTSYSTVIDLGAEDYKGENFELFVSTPALTATNLPNSDTLTVNVVAGTTTTPTTVIMSSIIALTGSTGAPATSAQVRLPSDCPRYMRVQFVAAGGTGDMSALDAVVGLRF